VSLNFQVKFIQPALSHQHGDDCADNAGSAWVWGGRNPQNLKQHVKLFTLTLMVAFQNGAIHVVTKVGEAGKKPGVYCTLYP